LLRVHCLQPGLFRGGEEGLVLDGLGGGDSGAHDQQQREAGDGGQNDLVPAGELLEDVTEARLPGGHRLVVEIALEVLREFVGRLVAAVAVLFHRLEHDPIQIAADQPAELARVRAPASGHRRAFRGGEGADPVRGAQRLHLPNLAADFIVVRLGNLVGIHRCPTGEQFVQYHAETVDIAARVYIRAVRPGFAPDSCRPGCP